MFVCLSVFYSLVWNSRSESGALCFAVIELIQTDVTQYPFHQQAPAYLRAHRYRYWFTEPKADGSVLSSVSTLKNSSDDDESVVLRKDTT